MRISVPDIPEVDRLPHLGRPARPLIVDTRNAIRGVADSKANVVRA